MIDKLNFQVTNAFIPGAVWRVKVSRMPNGKKRITFMPFCVADENKAFTSFGLPPYAPASASTATEEKMLSTTSPPSYLVRLFFA